MLGLATPFKTQNYGTKLQAFAMQNLFYELGYDVEVISYNHINSKKAKLKSLLSPKKVHYKLTAIKKQNSSLNNDEYNKCISERNKEFNNFVNENMHLTRTFSNLEVLQQKAKQYDAVICGSDQIWLPSHIKQGYYNLSFVPNGVRRIAYAPSIGLSTLSAKEQKLYTAFLEKMDAVSCRELSGCDIINSISSKNAQLVLDPTLMINKKIWDNLSGTEPIINGDYIFCYFLGNNPEHRHKVTALSKITGCKIVCLPHITEYVKSDTQYADFAPYNIGPDKFINLIKNAKYICTDSFHGSVFSTIFEKEFFVFQRFNSSDKKSTNTRLSSLLENLGLLHRQINNTQIDKYDWHTGLNSTIDYKSVNEKLSKLQNKSMQFIQNSLSGIKPSHRTHIEITDKNDCCGCSACADACPKKCISIEADNEGFVYPKISTADCINCSSCIKACPIINYKKGTNASTPYCAVNNDEDVRKGSTSGGIFTPLAEKVIENGGVVIGAAFDDSFQVHHIAVENLSELQKFRSSKYVQSNTTGIYLKTKKLLSDGRTVLFSGTPCQIRALKTFLKNDYENLICVDLFCHGVPSPKVWNLYLEYINPKHKKINDISFRDKKISWKDYSLTVKFNDTEKSAFWKKDPFACAFGNSVINRISCSSCRLKSFPRVSDITLGDFWKVSEIFPNMNDNKGTSLVLVNTEKGKKLFESINKKITTYEIPHEKFVTTYPVMGSPTKAHKNRTRFFNNFEKDNFAKLLMSCSTVDRKREFKIWRNKILNKLGILSVIKKIIH